MSVYVDNARIPYGRMKMCHMAADTTAELVAMADAIGIARKWIQNSGTSREHFDVCSTKAMAAIQRGAIPCSAHRIVELMHNKPLPRRAREREEPQ